MDADAERMRAPVCAQVPALSTRRKAACELKGPEAESWVRQVGLAHGLPRDTERQAWSTAHRLSLRTAGPAAPRLARLVPATCPLPNGVHDNRQDTVLGKWKAGGIYGKHLEIPGSLPRGLGHQEQSK